MSRPWRLAVGAAQLVFAAALVAGLYLDLTMLARLPELRLPAIGLSAQDPNAREDRAPAPRSPEKAPSVETPPVAPPSPPSVPVARDGRSVESTTEVQVATAETIAMAAPIEMISSLAFVEVGARRERARPTRPAENVHALAAHARHDAAPPPKARGPQA